MDKIPMQTLKHVEKVSSEEQINNLAIGLKSVQRCFKPTVRTRRVETPELDDKAVASLEYDIECHHLKETLPKIETELNLWTRDYKDLLEHIQKLHEDDKEDQVSRQVVKTFRF